MTVVREIPNRSAIRAFGTPSAASLLISAQSSKVITLQSLSVHFSPPKLFSFRAPPTPISGLVKRFSHADVIVDVGSPYRVELASRMKVGLRRRHGWFPACLSEVHAARPR